LGVGPRALPFSYTDDLADEAEITAAVEVARWDWPQWGAA
jgi:hypothetical protein